MSTPIFKDQAQNESILDHVKEGMKVYDANNQELGKVDFVYLGETSSEEVAKGNVPQTAPAQQNGSETLMLWVQKTAGKDELDPVLQKRLLYYGYAHVDVPGLLAHNRFIMPDQITQVTDKGIVLKATRKELIKE